ncbi:cyclophilin-like fold protein [Alteribacillus sp. HJP-4]|uniref:cyclophilin-like fold protein n=1 Tax=Alteribacillus sp. HJP-4 TaxID=2775394 RepID=UPI0035CCF8AA
MKKLLTLASAIMIVFTLSACGDDNNEGSNSNDSETRSNPDNEQENTSEEINNENTQNSTGNNDDSDNSEEKIIVTLDNGEIIINVYDNPTSREFLAQLPLTLTFEEFGGFEKLSYPPEELTTEGAPSGYTPEREDFAYYSPWGDVAMFYDDHRYSNGLVKLGEIESGVELLESMNDDFTVSIERMD